MVSTQSPIIRYYFNQDQAIYAIPFAYQITAELHVYLIDDESNRTDLRENVDYTVTAQSITLLNSAGFTAEYLIIQREGDVVQDMVLDNGFYVDVKKIEEALDTMTMRLQEMKLALQNTLKNPWEDWDQDADIMLPNIEKRKDAVLYFGSDGVTMKAIPWEDVAEIQEDVHEQQQLARDWASKTDGPVKDGEYSAKYHAQKTQALRDETEGFKTASEKIRTAMEEFVKKYCWYADQAALRAQQYSNACKTYRTAVEGLKNRMVELEAQTETYHEEVATMHQTVVEAKAVVVQAEQSCEEILIQMQEYINGFALRYQQAIDGVAAQELQSIANVNEVAEGHIGDMNAIKTDVAERQEDVTAKHSEVLNAKTAIQEYITKYVGYAENAAISAQSALRQCTGIYNYLKGLRATIDSIATRISNDKATVEQLRTETLQARDETEQMKQSVEASEMNVEALSAQVTSDKTVVAGDKAIVQQTKANIETLKGDIGNLVADAQAAASQASAPTVTVGNKLYTQSVIVRRGKRFLKTVEVVPEDDGTETGGEA